MQGQENENYKEIYPWYDGYWLYSYVKAKAYIKEHYPNQLKDFIQAFEVFKTPTSFKTIPLNNFLSQEQHNEIKVQIAQISKEKQEKHEFFEFGRIVVHDLPYFTNLQQSLVSKVSELVEEEVELSYNFLSLYNNLGILKPHLDAAPAKWTLDYCIEQSLEWPIYLSEVQEWPENFSFKQEWEKKLKKELNFNKFVLKPNNAILFSGTSQWHYRERISNENKKHFCHLLFFHFIPKGSSELCYPKKWSKIFGIPELDSIVVDFD